MVKISFKIIMNASLIIPLLSVVGTLIGPPLVVFGVSQWIYHLNNEKLLREIQQNPDRVKSIKIMVKEGQKPVIEVNFKDQGRIIAFPLSIKRIQKISESCQIIVEKEALPIYSET